MTDDAPTPKFYRMLRDTLFHTAGSIVSLLPEQVSPHMHELATFPADNHEDVTALRADNQRLTEAVVEMAHRLDRLSISTSERLDHLEAHHDEVPAAPEPEPAPEAKSDDDPADLPVVHETPDDAAAIA